MILSMQAYGKAVPGGAWRCVLERTGALSRESGPRARRCQGASSDDSHALGALGARAAGIRRASKGRRPGIQSWQTPLLYYAVAALNLSEP